MSVRITERFNGALAGCRVDEDAGVIHGAVLCGFTSANGRDYPRAVLEAAAPKYAGVKVHLNHSRDGRTIQDWIGVVESPAPGSDGRPRGRLELFKSDPFVPKLLEAARRYPNKFGLSHVAMANTSRRSGREVVESIDRIESVDFVTDPATVKGLFESVQRGQTMSSASKSAATRLLEQFQAAAPPATRRAIRKTLVELDTSRHQNAVTVAFEQAGHAVWSGYIAGEIAEDDMLAKLRKLARGHKDAGGSGDTSGVPSLESRVPTGRAFAESVRFGATSRFATAEDFARHIHGEANRDQAAALARTIRD